MLTNRCGWKFEANRIKTEEVDFSRGGPFSWGGLPMGSQQPPNRFQSYCWVVVPVSPGWCVRSGEGIGLTVVEILMGSPMMGRPPHRKINFSSFDSNHSKMPTHHVCTSGSLSQKFGGNRLDSCRDPMGRPPHQKKASPWKIDFFSFHPNHSKLSCTSIGMHALLPWKFGGNRLDS
jgi:hypothetical protein